MTTRRQMLIALGAGGFASPLASFGQPQAKVWRIGFLNGGSPATAGQNFDAFRQGLRELGYVEARNILIEARWAEGRMESLPRLAAELVQIKVDVIVTSGSPLVQVLQQATTTIPIVMASGADPTVLGFASSLARPGENVTGLTNMSTETTAKLVELAREIAPGASRVAVLHSGTPAMTANWNDARKAGEALKIVLVPVKATSANEIQGAIAAMKKERVGAIIVPADVFFLTERKKILELASQAKLPAVYARREYVEEGGLISYGLNLTDMFRRSASFVDKIFKGAKPGDLPFEQPTKFELVINMKTARTLGMKIPQSVLFRADRVIE